MHIIIGLGNPGEKFNYTPHNTGFDALDFFAAKHEFPEFTLSKKHEALVSEKDNVTLVKPQTFMNESGRTISNFKFQISNLVVIHDDIDIPLGKIKVSKDSGAGGHKGVASIIQTLGTKDFTRIKIGVEVDPLQKAEAMVLKKFSPEQYEVLKNIFPNISAQLEKIIF